MPHVDAIVMHGLLQRIPTFGLDLAAGARAAIVFRGHLREQAIAKAERRVAKRTKLAALDQFAVDHRARDNDFGPARPDAYNLFPLFEGKAADEFGDALHFRARDDRGAAFPEGRMRWLAAAARAAAVPEVAIAALTLDATIFAETRPTSRAMKPRMRCSSPLRGGSWLQEFVRQPHGAERQAHSVANVSVPRNSQFATAAAEVDHEYGRRAEAQIRDQSEMDEAAFFEAGDDVDRPSGGRSHPLQKCLRVARIAQGAGGDDADRIRAQTLRSAVKAAENLDGFRHRFGRQKV